MARERALLARTLLLEIVVDALCDAEAVDGAAIRSRTAALQEEWPEGIDPEHLLDTRRGLAARLEHAVARARAQRDEAREMRARAIAMRNGSSPPAQTLDDAHEALALLQLLDGQLFDTPPSSS